MTPATCRLCHTPLSTCACVTDDALAGRLTAIRPPPLRESLAAREQIRVRQFPNVVAGDLLEWAALVIEAIGDSPAARAATHADHQRWVQQQLSLVTETRAQLQIARAALHYLTTQIEHAQALLVGEGQVEEAAAVLHDLLTVPGVSVADERVDAALARAGEAVPR